MTEAEVQEMLTAHNKVQLATNSRDGFPHLVTMQAIRLRGRAVQGHLLGPHEAA